MASEVLKEADAAISALERELARREEGFESDGLDDAQLERELRNQQEKWERSESPKELIIEKRLDAIRGELEYRSSRGGAQIDWRLMSTRHLKQELRRLRELRGSLFRDIVERKDSGP